jgi:hypothetical protein
MNERKRLLDLIRRLIDGLDSRDRCVNAREKYWQPPCSTCCWKEAKAVNMCSHQCQKLLAEARQMLEEEINA